MAELFCRNLAFLLILQNAEFGFCMKLEQLQKSLRRQKSEGSSACRTRSLLCKTAEVAELVSAERSTGRMGRQNRQKWL